MNSGLAAFLSSAFRMRKRDVRRVKLTAAICRATASDGESLLSRPHALIAAKLNDIAIPSQILVGNCI